MDQLEHHIFGIAFLLYLDQFEILNLMIFYAFHCEEYHLNLLVPINLKKKKKLENVLKSIKICLEKC